MKLAKVQSQNTTAKLYMNQPEKSKRNYAKEYKKRVKFSPLISSAMKSETRYFMLDAATSDVVENRGDVVIKEAAYNLGKSFREFSNLVIQRNPEYKQVFPNSLPRYRDNALLDIELCSLTLASYQLEQGELESIPFTLLISDKTYKACLNSNKSEISYLSDRLSKQLKKHTGRVVDYVFHLEVKEILIKRNGKLEKHKLPHLHGNIVCTRKEFGDGNGYNKQATVRNALKSINASKQSKAFNDNVETFNKHELRGEFELRQQRSITQLAIRWAHYISKNATDLKSKSKNDELRGNPKTLPDSSTKLFTSTRNIRRNAEEIYNEIRKGYGSVNVNINAAPLVVDSGVKIDAFSAMLDERLNANFNPNDTTGGAPHEEAAESETMRFEDIPQLEIDELLLTDDGFAAYMRSPEAFVKFVIESRNKGEQVRSHPTATP